MLEELHYHSVNDSDYIKEIRTALIDEGSARREDGVDKPLKLKNSFKGTNLYKRGVVYINERVVNRNEYVRSFADIRVSQKNYEYSIPTARGDL